MVTTFQISNTMKVFHSITPLTLACLVCLLIFSSSAAEAQNYFTQFNKNPVNVVNRTGGANQELILRAREGNVLIFDIPGVEGAMTEMPINTPNLLLEYRPPEAAYSRASDLMNARAYPQAVQALRPIVYPLFQYIAIPERNFDAYNYIGDFYFALVRAGETAEAMEILARLDLNQLNPTFVETTFALAEKLIEQGKTDQAARALLRIPFGPDNQEYLGLIMRVTAQIRDAGGLRDALAIYQRIQDIPNQPYMLEAVLWCAYCNFKLDNMETARLFLDKAGHIERAQREFSLARLIDGLIHIQTGDKIKAMDSISQGVVFSEIGYNWMPELLYSSAQCYMLMERPDTAKQIYGDVILFFPDSPFAEKSRQALSQI